MQNALIISPFATAPLDAGHRRRVYQMTRLLADAGYRITFLLFAFENPWYWRHDEKVAAILREQWDETLLVYANSRVGQPPASGDRHELDEWWDPALEATLANLASRRFFDLVVVHNVWLSKAFDFFPQTTVKVLETHDLFWKRPEVFERMGIAPEFFIPHEAAEVFGAKRADLAVMIQESEGVELLTRTQMPVISVPFYDRDLEQQGRARGSIDYRSPHKVSFGVLASDNAFNIAGLDQLLYELEDCIADTFAPVEVVVAGRVGERIYKRAGVKCVGVVESEAAFYETVDYAIAPVFEGTGFKVKAADALAVGMPILLSGHAAKGVNIDPSCVCEGAKEMAQRMVEIALRRPALAVAADHVREARADLRERTEAASAMLVDAVESQVPVLAVDLVGATPEMLLSWTATARHFMPHFSLLLLLSELDQAMLAQHLPHPVQALTQQQFAARPRRRPVTVLGVAGPVDRSALAIQPTDVVLHDARWRAADAGLDPDTLVFETLPLLTQSIVSEPACMRLKRKLNDPKSQDWNSHTRLVMVERAFAIERLTGGDGVVNRLVSLADPKQLCSAVFALVEGRVLEVAWHAATGTLAQRLIVEAAALSGRHFHGPLDQIAVSPGRLPSNLTHELSANAERSVAELKTIITDLRGKLGL